MRKAVASLALLVFLAVYIILVGSLSGHLAGLPALVQLLVYVLAGFLWVLPIRPLFRWMNTPQADRD